MSFGVVEAEQVQDRRLEVVDVDLVLDGGEAELVGLRRRVMPGLTPPPASHMVKASMWWSRPTVSRDLAHRRAAELAAPDDQRVVEQAALLQVLDQGRARAGRRRGRPCRGRLARSWPGPPWWSQSVW